MNEWHSQHSVAPSSQCVTLQSQTMCTRPTRWVILSVWDDPLTKQVIWQCEFYIVQIITERNIFAPILRIALVDFPICYPSWICWIIKICWRTKQRILNANMANKRVEISLIIKWITCTSIMVFIVLNDQVEGRSAEIVTATRTNSLTTVQLCRATCIRKYVPTSDDPENCTKMNHCAMCFDHCGSLDAKPKATFEKMCSNITCVSVSYFSISYSSIRQRIKTNKNI